MPRYHPLPHRPRYHAPSLTVGSYIYHSSICTIVLDRIQYWSNFKLCCGTCILAEAPQSSRHRVELRTTALRWRNDLFRGKIPEGSANTHLAYRHAVEYHSTHTGRPVRVLLLVNRPRRARTNLKYVDIVTMQILSACSSSHNFVSIVCSGYLKALMTRLTAYLRPYHRIRA
jgi:hypothetical protein